MTAIKICGLGRLEEAMLCADLGVDAIGLNFVPGSARRVALDVAQGLAQCVGEHCRRVAVVRDASESDVRQLLAAVELDVLQFHGSESAAFCRQFDRPYVKVVAVDSMETGRLDEQVQQAAESYEDACALLLDTAVAGSSGGTGQGFDWQRWPTIEPEMALGLAGGLNPDNVAEAIAQTGCAIVDVAGGVEGSQRGVKDLARIEAFVTAVRQQDEARKQR